MMAMKQRALLIGFLYFLLAGLTAAGTAIASVQYHMTFRGYSADTLRGVEEYFVEFPLYAGHRLVDETASDRAYEYESSAGAELIEASLRRMFAYLDVDGVIDIKATRITVTHPDYTAPPPLEPAPVPEPVEETALAAPTSAAPKSPAEPATIAAPLKLHLTTARGDMPSFAIGETFDLTVELSRDAWVYCYYRQVDGAVVKFFPNPHHETAKLKGGTLHRIPGNIYPSGLAFTEPPGNELLTCYAAGRDVGEDLPAPLQEPDFAPLPAGMEGRLQELFEGLADTDVARDSLPIAVTR
jgi:hypothetical protein